MCFFVSTSYGSVLSYSFRSQGSPRVYPKIKNSPCPLLDLLALALDLLALALDLLALALDHAQGLAALGQRSKIGQCFLRSDTQLADRIPS